MNASHKLINQDSGKVEYYTPSFIVEAARQVMGSIDLDPASSSIANNSIKATRFYTINQPSLELPWIGNIWMNHPFSRKNNYEFINKLLHEVKEGNVKQACCITFAATSEKWFRPLLTFPQCYLFGRTNYILPDGSQKVGVTKGSVVTYIGPNNDKFREVFSKYGAVKI
jgi:hypothetical protein